MSRQLPHANLVRNLIVSGFTLWTIVLRLLILYGIYTYI